MQATTYRTSTTRTIEPDLPALRLIRHTTRSFTLIAGRWEDLADWLVQYHGFKYHTVADQRELARLWDAQHQRCLIVYQNRLGRNSILCQGSHALDVSRLIHQFLSTDSTGDLFDYFGDVIAEVR